MTDTQHRICKYPGGCEIPGQTKFVTGWCAAHYQRRYVSTTDDAGPPGLVHPPQGCSVDGCETKHYGKGWCFLHYMRSRSGVPLDKPLRITDGTQGCSIEGCDREHKGKGWCELHYGRSLSGTALDAPLMVHDGTQGCIAYGCELPHLSKGRCNGHYMRQQNYGRDWMPCDICGKHLYDISRDGLYRCPSCRLERVGETQRRIAQSRRARVMGAEGSWTGDEWQALLAAWDDRCAYGVLFPERALCDGVNFKGNLTVGHILPLARGGSNWIDNIAPLCMSCNSSQCAKTLAEWLDYHDDDLPLDLIRLVATTAA